MDYAAVFDEVVAGVLNDDEWEYPKEEREFMLWDPAWTILNL